MRILKDQCCGLIIDLQEKIFPVMAENEQLLNACKRLISGLTVLQVPMLVTQQYTKGLGETLADIRPLFPDFSYVEKKSFSCMDDSGFVDRLEQVKPVFVLIAGIESHVCILQTAVDLKEKGYQPVILADCITSRKLQEKEIALERFKTEGILISTVESILFELTRYSDSVEFKAISKIIK